MKKGMITMRSSHVSEFETEVDMKGQKYLVQTEKGSLRKPLVTTRVYFRGRIVFSTDTDYRDVLHEPYPDKRLQEIMRCQHDSAVAALKTQKIRADKTPADYLKEVQDLLKRSRKEDAILVLNEGLGRHPDNPFLLSYRGYLDATVNKRFREGIAECTRAVAMLKKTVPFGEEFFYPLLYLNLGMAYLSAGKRKEAFGAFHKGLEADSENAELRRMIKKLGMRRSPPIPFFGRSHFLNKYLGKLLSRVKKQT